MLDLFGSIVEMAVKKHFTQNIKRTGL